MQKIKFYNSIILAELAHNLLKKNGIASMVQKRGVRFSGDMGDSCGADLFVKDDDVKKATEILESNE